MATKKPAEPEATDHPGEMSIWERIEQPRMPRTLDHGQIAAAAVEIADQDGLDAVSMRRLASHLGVATMGLYRYVSNKEDILWLMTDAVFAKLPAPPKGTTGWREVARFHAEETRALVHRHPWMVEAGARLPVGLTPGRMAIFERALQSLDGLGLDADTCFAVMITVSSFVWGFVGGEVAQQALMKRKGWATRDDLRNAYSPHMRWLMATGRYPLYERYAHTATKKDDADGRFRFGLDSLLAGLAARLGI